MKREHTLSRLSADRRISRQPKSHFDLGRSYECRVDRCSAGRGQRLHNLEKMSVPSAAAADCMSRRSFAMISRTSILLSAASGSLPTATPREHACPGRTTTTVVSRLAPHVQTCPFSHRNVVRPAMRSPARLRGDSISIRNCPCGSVQSNRMRHNPTSN